MLNMKGIKKKKEFFEAELEDIIRVIVDIKRIEIEEGVKKDKKKNATTTDRKRIKNPNKAWKFAIFIVIILIISIYFLNPLNIDNKDNNNEDLSSRRYTGSGDFVIEIDSSFVKQNAYLVKVKRGSEEKQFLQIVGYDLNNERTHSFVEGVQINSKDTEKIEVKTSGDWEIELIQLQNVSVASVPGEFIGSGNYVFNLENSIELAIISGNKDKRPFHIRGYSKDLKYYKDIVSPTEETLEEYVASFFTSFSISFFVIRATGNWEIKMK